MNKLRIKLISDLHLELCVDSKGIDQTKFEVFSSVLENTENADILVIAGDMCKANLLKWYTTNLPFDQYQRVIYVPGNHEYWDTTIDKANLKLDEFATAYDNLILLRDDYCKLNDVYVYGMTYWYNGLTPLDVWQMKQTLNDYNKIRQTNYSKTTPEFFQLLSLQSEKKFFEWASDKEKILLVTHHPTSRKFRQPNEPDFPGYGSIMNFPRDFDTSKIICQVHGHTHQRATYMSEYDILTRVNAVGYIGFERVNTNSDIFTL